MQIGTRHLRHRSIEEQNLLFVARSDQGPIQLEFALLQKRKIAGLKHMLNHLVEHQYHSLIPKKELLKNFERTGLIYKPCKEQLSPRASFILFTEKLGILTIP